MTQNTNTAYRKWMHTILRLSLWLCAGLSILLLLCLAIFQHEGIKKATVSRLTTELEAQTGWHLEMQEVRGFLPFHLIGKQVQLSQGDQNILIADHVEVALSPFELFFGRLTFAFVDLEDVHLVVPSSSPTEVAITPAAIQKELPPFPFALRIERFRLKNFTSEPAFLSFPCDLMGSIDVDPVQGTIRGEVDFCRHQENAMATEVEFELKQNADGLSGIFSLQSYPHPTFPLTLEGKVTLSPDGFVRLETIEGILHSSDHPNEALAFAQGHLTLTPSLEIQDSRFDFSVPDLASFNPSFPLSGELTAVFHLGGSAFSPILKAEILGKKTAIGLHSIDKFSSQLTLSRPEKELEGTWNLNGEIDHVPFSFNTFLLLNAPSLLTFPHAELTLPSTKLQGHLAYSFIHHVWTGDLKGEMSDLSPFSTFLPSPLQGNASLHTTLSYDVQKGLEETSEDLLCQKLEIAMEGAQVSYAAWGIGSASLKIRLCRPFDQPAGEVTLRVHDISQDAMLWKELTWESKIDKQQTSWPYSFSASGALPQEVKLSSSGHWRATKQALDLHLEFLTGEIASYPLALIHPTDIRIESDLIEVAPFHLTLGEGSVEAFAGIADKEVHTEIRIENIPVEALPFKPIVDLAASGRIFLQASLTGSLKEPTGELTANLHQISLQANKWSQIPPFEAHLEGIIKPSSLSAKGHITGLGEHPIVVNTELPLILTLSPWNVSLQPEGPLTLHAEAEGEIASFLKLIRTDSSVSIAGYGQMAFDVAGTWNKPEVNGNVAIKNGTYEDLDTGAVFEEIAFVIEGNGQQLLLKDLSAVDGNVGKVSGSGVMQWDPAQSFPFTCQLHLDKCVMVHLDYALGSATGTLNYKGNILEGSVEGKLVLNKAKFTIPEEVPPQMRAIEITYVNLPSQTPVPYQSKKSKKKWPLHLDINLDIPEKAVVRGRDLKSEWGGNLTFTGTTSDPLVTGSMKIISGEYLFNGRSFISSKGTITFEGDPKKTSLYVIAEQQIEDNRVEIILKGLLSDPVVTFRSNPPMSQREILSWILFNRGIAEITPLQGAELTQTVFTLSGGKDSPDFLSRLRKSVGIDRVDISSKDTHDSNEVSVRVGKYISRGVFVSVNKSINADANQLAIEAKLMRHVKIQAEVGDNAEGKMSLKWEKDY